MRKDAIESLRKISGEELRVNIMVRFMHQNKAYQFNLTENKNDNEELLQKLKEDYQRYRKEWKEQPKKIIRDKFTNNEIKKENIFPLCIDIETAAVCDLACPHCYRQFIATPDKIISDDLCYKIIDQAAKMNVPSIKFNWRGEPLLHPKLSDFIKYAKKKGILETIINTNATKLNTNLTKKQLRLKLPSPKPCGVILEKEPRFSFFAYEKMGRIFLSWMMFLSSPKCKSYNLDV